MNVSRIFINTTFIQNIKSYEKIQPIFFINNF